MIGEEVRRDLGAPLLDELYRELGRGDHLALLGPRGVGKAVVILELVRRAENDGQHIIHLAGRDARHKDRAALLADVARQAGVSLPGESRGGMALRLERIFRQAARKAPRGVWLFVSNLLLLPTVWVRDLLGALQATHEQPETEGRLSALLSAGDDFIHYTYGPNSPYRYARKILVLGIDRETTARYVDLIRNGRPLLGSFNDPLPPAERSLHKDALTLLHHQTGGYLHLVREIVSSSMRFLQDVKGPTPSGAWNVDYVKELIARYSARALANDSLLWFAFRAVQEERSGLDLLRAAYHSEPASVPVQGTDDWRGHLMPELSGLVRIEGFRARIASPLIQLYLTKVFQRTGEADAVARKGDWAEAWKLYREASDHGSGRYPGRESSLALLEVIREWEDHFIALSADAGPRLPLLKKHLEEGARYLLGIDEVAWEAGVPWPSQGGPYKDLSDRGTRTSHAIIRLEKSRRSVLSTHLRPSLARRSERDSRPVVRLTRLEEGREIDSNELELISDALDRFWSAWRVASEAHLAWLRELHIGVIQLVSQKLLKDGIGTDEILARAARALIFTRQYRRVQFCLVDGTRTHIQAVCRRAARGYSSIDFPTDMPLYDGAPRESWDVQRMVVEDRRSIAIEDASKQQSNPMTQAELCSKIGITGMGVVPLIVRKQVIGTVHLEWIDGRMPTYEELRVFEEMAGQLAVALTLCRHLTYLRSSLNQLPGRVCLADPARKIIFSNARDSEARKIEPCRDGFNPATTACPGDVCSWCDRVEDTRDCLFGRPRRVVEPRRWLDEPKQHSQGETYDRTLAPIDEHREELPWSKTLREDGRVVPDPRIGYVMHTFDLTTIQTISGSLGRWLNPPPTPSGGGPLSRTADAVLDHFIGRKHRWARLYLIEKHGRREYLRCVAQRGLERAENIRRFTAREILEDDPARDRGMPWPILPGRVDLAIMHQKPSLPYYRHELRASPMGFVEYDIHEPDETRTRLEKEDLQWLEAPLWSDANCVGLLSVSMPDPPEITPLDWGVLRWTVQAVAVALDQSVRGLREAKVHSYMAKDQAYRNVYHQLGNFLAAPSRLMAKLARRELDLPVELRDRIVRDANSLARAEEILTQFKQRYSSARPFPDRVRHNLPTFLAGLTRDLQSVHPEFGRISLVLPIPEVSIEASRSAFHEIFLTLARNSAVHSGRFLHEIEIEVRAVRINGPHRRLPDPNGQFVAIRFRDNGRGVPDELKPRLFEPPEIDSEFAPGLGLAIVLDFVERHGGWVSEAGVYGSHSQFEIGLPTRGPA